MLREAIKTGEKSLRRLTALWEEIRPRLGDS